ncbi:hypothetical protein B7494_g6810 [Chlorociboria aeruginascens]|nr:hypothetical protein B7494_g6810 [Chlorociboria aeruginascens]
MTSELQLSGQRIQVIGVIGAGKTTFARRLGKELSIPVCELDFLFHKSRAGDALSEDDARQSVQALVESNDDHWVQLKDVSYNIATDVFWIDTPLLLTLWRVITRTIWEVLTIPGVLRRELSGNSLIAMSLRVRAKKHANWSKRVATDSRWKRLSGWYALFRVEVQDPRMAMTSVSQQNVESAATVAIDILLFGWSDLQLSAYTWDQVYSNSPSHVKEIIGDAPYCQVEPIIRVPLSTDTEQMCANEIAINIVGVNRTFDHLYISHKNHLLLSAWLATKTLLCAVSTASPSDPSHKKLAQLSESFERRQSAVRQYIEGFQMFERRPFELKVVPRQNYGPQVPERKLDAVVLSTESRHYGDIVNRLRVEAFLPPVKVLVVDIVQAAGSTFSLPNNAHKLMTRMSSSLIRESLDKRALKFILLIGFAGVGKFTIASQLANYLAFAGSEARVVHNHLLADLADAMRSKIAPVYQTFRRQLRDLVFDTISTDEHISPGTAFIFTGNFSQSMVGRTAAQEYKTAALRYSASFIPVTIHCNIEELEQRIIYRSRYKVSSRKLMDPVHSAEIAAHLSIHRH